MDKDILNKFLITAKKSTYASEKSLKVLSSRVGSSDYEYKENNLTYHDTYFGGINFIGEEIVYYENIPYWGMNYYGKVLDENVSEEAMDRALKPALMLVENSDIPIRGPKEFKSGIYTYTFKVEGNITNFSGIEEIYAEDKLIYILKCNGGLIK